MKWWKNWKIAGCLRQISCAARCLTNEYEWKSRCSFRPWVVTERSRPGCFSFAACGSLRLGCASAVTLVWPSAPRLFTCIAMPSYASPNLSETTLACYPGNMQTHILMPMWDYSLGGVRRGMCKGHVPVRTIFTVAPFRSTMAVRVEAHSLYTCYTHTHTHARTPGLVQ